MGRIVAGRVIALPDSPRLEDFYAQSARIVSLFETFPACDGRVEGGAAETSFNWEAFERREGCRPPLTDAACTISHVSVIEGFAREEGAPDDVLLVAEDDARFADGVDEVLEQIVSTATDVDIMVLADSYGDLGPFRIFSPPGQLFQLSALSPRARSISGTTYRFGPHIVGDVWSAGFYLISRRAAQQVTRFVASCGGPHWRADTYDLWVAPAGLTLQAVQPSLATWAEGESTLGHHTMIELYRASQEDILRSRATSPWMVPLVRARMFAGKRRRVLTGIAHATVVDLKARRRR